MQIKCRKVNGILFCPKAIRKGPNIGVFLYSLIKQEITASTSLMVKDSDN